MNDITFTETPWRLLSQGNSTGPQDVRHSCIASATILRSLEVLFFDLG